MSIVLPDAKFRELVDATIDRGRRRVVDDLRRAGVTQTTAVVGGHKEAAVLVDGDATGRARRTHGRHRDGRIKTELHILSPRSAFAEGRRRYLRSSTCLTRSINFCASGGAVSVATEMIVREDAIDILAGQRLMEFQPRISRLGFDAHPDFGELAGAAGLFFVAVFGIAF